MSSQPFFVPPVTAVSPKASRLEIPTKPVTARPQRSPVQRLPSTALFEGPSSRNASFVDLSSPQNDTPDPQRLPRPQAAPSLAGPSVRPSVIQAQTIDGRQFSQKSFSTLPQQGLKQDEIQPEALWAEMQRTLADVELAALNTGASSHLFGAAHSRALEELRAAQVSLAQAWTRSETVEGDYESDDSMNSNPNSATVGKAEGLTSSPSKPKKPGSTPQSPNTNRSGRRRASSTASAGAMARDLEAETERDIQMARKRREANDRYFQQVNKGVLDVVRRLDEVANAMKNVERESRDVWEDGSLSSDDTNAGPALTGTDKSKKSAKHVKYESGTDDVQDSDLDRILTKTTATGSGTEGFSSDSMKPTKKGKKG